MWKTQIGISASGGVGVFPGTQLHCPLCIAVGGKTSGFGGIWDGWIHRNW